MALMTIFYDLFLKVFFYDRRRSRLQESTLWYTSSKKCYCIVWNTNRNTPTSVTEYQPRTGYGYQEGVGEGPDRHRLQCLHLQPDQPMGGPQRKHPRCAGGRTLRVLVRNSYPSMFVVYWIYSQLTQYERLKRKKHFLNIRYTFVFMF